MEKCKKPEINCVCHYRKKAGHGIIHACGYNGICENKEFIIKSK